jgi:hypothetical protein
MEAICFSETSFDFLRTARHYIPEDRNLYNHCSENRKSYIEVMIYKINYNGLIISKEELITYWSTKLPTRQS